LYYFVQSTRQSLSSMVASNDWILDENSSTLNPAVLISVIAQSTWTEG